MDIRNWPLGRIMQLPDHCFGRRFVISCLIEGSDAAPVWDISEMALPEWAVLWELVVWCREGGGAVSSLRLGLGDQLPTSAAMMGTLEPLIPGLGITGIEPRSILLGYFIDPRFQNIRFPIHSVGRRLVIEVSSVATKTPFVGVGIVISSIPKEVPDCLLSV